MRQTHESTVSQIHFVVSASERKKSINEWKREKLFSTLFVLRSLLARFFLCQNKICWQSNSFGIFIVFIFVSRFVVIGRSTRPLKDRHRHFFFSHFTRFFFLPNDFLFFALAHIVSDERCQTSNRMNQTGLLWREYRAKVKRSRKKKVCVSESRWQINYAVERVIKD